MSVKEFKQWIDSRLDSEALPETTLLHHYTSAAALEKILQTREFHVTDAFHQNDPSQITHGMKAAREILNEGELEHWVPVFTEASLKAFGYFLACFCADGNRLDLWRFYGDDGRGFRLTVHPSSFQEEGIRYWVKDVEYNKAQTRTLHREVTQKALEQLRRLPVENYDEIQEFLFSRLLWNSIFAKPKDYQSEGEIRLLVMDDMQKLKEANRIKCKVRGSSLVPYIPLKFIGDGAILEIMAGPAAAETAVENVKHLLRQHGWGTEIPVSRSPIRYRPPERI